MIFLLSGYFYVFESDMIMLDNHTLADADLVDAVCEFERSMAATYPLGNHTFSIQHPSGVAYFDFFARLGTYKYICYVQNKKVLATACGILRKIRDRDVWYVCDLKVHPTLRGEHLPWRMFCKSFFPGCLQSLQGYGVTMLPPNMDQNRVTDIATKQGFELADILCIYFITHAELQTHSAALQQILGPMYFVDNSGKKDIVLDGAAVKVLHIVRYPTNLTAANATAPYYMFCVPESHAKLIPLVVFSRARVVGYNMQDTHLFPSGTWDFINTAEI
jgi:hypothetical protein